MATTKTRADLAPRPGRGRRWSQQALRILDEEGREALTMRRLATSLGVEAASLYAHVAEQGRARRRRAGQPCSTRSRSRRPCPTSAQSIVRRLRELPAGAAAAPGDRDPDDRARAPIERRSSGLRGGRSTILEAAGLSDDRAAVDAHVTMVAFVLGFILQEVSRPSGSPAARRAAIGSGPGPHALDVGGAQRRRALRGRARADPERNGPAG